jgi:hypothetical protein
MPVNNKPILQFPKNTEDLGKILRGLQLDIADDELPDDLVREEQLLAAIAAEVLARNGAIASAVTAHEGESDPHPTYINATELAALVQSGAYTPTLVNVANLDDSTAFECQYLRVGTVVHVSGRVSVDPTTTATPTLLSISLPIASNFANNEDCAGVAFSPAFAGAGAGIFADVTNNVAQLQWVADDVSNHSMYFTFTYSIL